MEDGLLLSELSKRYVENFWFNLFQDKTYFLSENQKSFNEEAIRSFLIETGIAIFDTAYQIKRLKGNASDKFLEIVTPTDLAVLLKQIPQCHTIMTTGDKATDTLISVLPENTEKPLIGTSTSTYFADRDINLYRLPSSSRAYPLALEKKAEAYQKFFKEIGFL